MSYFKGALCDLSMASISRCPRKRLKSRILAYSDFAFSKFYKMCTIMCCKCSIEFYVEKIIGSDITDHIINSKIIEI